MYQPVMPKYESYLRDESRLVGAADEIYFPKTAAELACAIRQAHEDGKRFIVQGARTGIAGGAVPAGELIINTTQMDGIIDLCEDNGEFLLRVQAGASLQQIERFLLKPAAPDNWPETAVAAVLHLNKAGRHIFAPNPTETTATIGGIFATAARGASSQRYGGTSGQVQKLLWVTPAGQLWDICRGTYVFLEKGCPLPNGRFLSCSNSLPQSPAEVFAPRQGMDLIDFLAGTGCLLGAAAELELRLVPQPAENWGVLYFFTGNQTLFTFAEQLAAKGAPALAAVEYYDQPVLALLEQSRQTNSLLKRLPALPQYAAGALYVELCSSDAQQLEDELVAQLDEFIRLGGREEDTWAALGLGEMEKFREMRHAVPETINGELDKVRLKLPEIIKNDGDFYGGSRLAVEALLYYQNQLRQGGVDGYIYGHLLQNRLHVELMPENEVQLVASVQQMEQMVEYVVSGGGCIISENGAGRLKQKWLDKHMSDAQKAQMQAICCFFEETV